MHYYAQGRNGAFALREPIILGHESAGTIVAVGPDCHKELKPGKVLCRFTYERGSSYN